MILFLRNVTSVVALAPSLYREPSKQLQFSLAVLVGSAVVSIFLDFRLVMITVAFGLGFALLSLAMRPGIQRGPAVARGIFAAAVASWPTGLVLEHLAQEFDLPFLLVIVCLEYLFNSVWAQVTYRPGKMMTRDERAVARQIRADVSGILIEEYGQRIGTYKDKEIPAFIRSVTGEVFYFVGVAPANEAWRPKPGQTVVSPGLLFEVSPRLG